MTTNGATATNTTRPGHTKTGDVTYRPPLDLYDLPDRYEIHFDLPGASPEDIDVTVDDGVLTVEARVPWRYPEGLEPLHVEFGIGDFRRQVRIGEDIDSEALEASYVDGVLTIALPKRAERRARRVQVRAG
jgi:HSP20 family protein